MQVLQDQIGNVGQEGAENARILLSKRRPSPGPLAEFLHEAMTSWALGGNRDSGHGLTLFYSYMSGAEIQMEI